jgi:hypothetical protein
MRCRGCERPRTRNFNIMHNYPCFCCLAPACQVCKNLGTRGMMHAVVVGFVGSYRDLEAREKKDDPSRMPNWGIATEGVHRA